MFNHKIGLIICFVFCLLAGCNEPPQSFGHVSVFIDHPEGGFILTSDAGSVEAVDLVDMSASDCENLEVAEPYFRVHCEVELPSAPRYAITPYDVEGYTGPTSSFFDLIEDAAFQLFYVPVSDQQNCAASEQDGG